MLMMVMLIVHISVMFVVVVVVYMGVVCYRDAGRVRQQWVKYLDYGIVQLVSSYIFKKKTRLNCKLHNSSPSQGPWFGKQKPKN